MRAIFNKIDFVVGNADILTALPEKSAFGVFDERAINFLSALSSKLLSDREAKIYPDVVTFAFWCRKANVAAIAKPYANETRLGRGVAFHIAPSNVPVNFAYTLVSGLLSGNSNVVRLPSKNFPQTALICKAIAELLPENYEIAERLCLVRYNRDSEITNAISSICSSRVIWGGDSTVNEIRKSPIPPRANEITFPDRYSICVIDADKYLAEFDKSQVARDFFNDTYLSDQNACTAPRIVFWYGNKISSAKEIFWTALSEIVEKRYNIQPVQVVNKLTTFYEFAAQSECSIAKNRNYNIVRIELNRIPDNLSEHFDNSGYFYEYTINSLDEIIPLCKRKCQTLSYIGFDAEQLSNLIYQHATFGVDRIVPIGKTMDFSLIWDGIDIVRTLSRSISTI
jgi:hypothetical protein